MGSKLVYWLTDSLLITGETLPESLSAQTRNTAADFLCALSRFQCTLGFLGREVGPAPLQHPTRQRVLTHPNCCPPRRLEQRLSRDPSGKSWPVWTPLSVRLPGASWSGSRLQSETIISTRRAGLSFLPAYLIAVIRASISSVTVSPRPRIISFDMKAATSPARESMSIACPEH